MSTAPDTARTAPSPWWRQPMMWMVVGGPLLVVLASFATLVLALRFPDPVIQTSKAAAPAEQPAVQARNHAATPGR